MQFMQGAVPPCAIVVCTLPDILVYIWAVCIMQDAGDIYQGFY